MPSSTPGPLPDAMASRICKFLSTQSPAEYERICNDALGRRALVMCIRTNYEIELEQQTRRAATAVAANAPAPTGSDNLNNNLAEDETRQGTSTMHGAGNVGQPAAQSNIDNTAVQRRPILQQSEQPPLPPIICDILGLSSNDFVSWWYFEQFCGTPELPFPLNMIVRILKNKANKKTGTTKTRLMEVDNGSGRRTTVVVDHGSVLYQIKGNPIALIEGSYAILWDVDDIVRSTYPAVKFSRRARAEALPNFTDAMWQQVCEWQRRMVERDQRLYLQ